MRGKSRDKTSWKITVPYKEYCVYPNWTIISGTNKRAMYCVLEVSRFPESELHGPDSESEFGRSRPGVGVAFFRNWLTYRAVPIPLKELQGVWSNSLFRRNHPESESHFWGIGSPLLCIRLAYQQLTGMKHCFEHSKIPSQYNLGSANFFPYMIETYFGWTLLMNVVKNNI